MKLKMLNDLKIFILTLLLIMVIIGAVSSLTLWVISSFWWLITNNMIDRNLFVQTVLGVTTVLTIVTLVLTIPKK